MLMLVLAQPVAAPSQAAPATDFRYDIVSIKPSGNTVQWSGDDEHSDGITIRNLTLEQIIVDAYDLVDTTTVHLVFGGPKWASTQKFDLDAKLDPEHVAAFKALTAAQQKTARHIMLQAVLVEHFHLKAHRGRRDMPVYALTVAKGGLKLKSYEDNAGKSGPQPAGSFGMGDGFINGTGISLDNIAFALNAPYCRLDRVVVDRTGVSGTYIVYLHWAGLGHEENSTDPTLFTALEEQAGLRLEKARAPLDIVVVEQVEQPVAN